MIRRREDHSTWFNRFRAAAFAFCVIATVCLLAAPSRAQGAQAHGVQAQTAQAQTAREHRLKLYNTHTGERIDIVYRRGEAYLAEALAKLDYFLRDHNSGEVLHYDPHLFDILEDLTKSVGRVGAEFEIVCGYRTPLTNANLRGHTDGVAKHSLHMHAKAIDLRLPGTDTLELRNAALALHRGGVGYYPHSDFIHVDTGRVTHWCFGCSGSSGQ